MIYETAAPPPPIISISENYTINLLNIDFTLSTAEIAQKFSNPYQKNDHFDVINFENCSSFNDVKNLIKNQHFSSIICKYNIVGIIFNISDNFNTSNVEIISSFYDNLNEDSPVFVSFIFLDKLKTYWNEAYKKPIYWLEVEINCTENAELIGFLTDFLTKSLKNYHSGISKFFLKTSTTFLKF